ncbi:MAG: DNA-processing protein DprA [Gemmatimonadales bacterium]
MSASDLLAGDRDHEVVATTALIRAKVLPVTRLAAVIEYVGSAVKLVQLQEEDRLFAPADVTHDLVGAVTPEQLSSATRDVANWRKQDYAIHTVLDPEYPAALLAIFNRPPLLFIAGRWEGAESQRAVAVVGTRKATPDGVRRAQRLTRALVQARFTILSGLAAGIDTAAHTTALETGGQTSAVMGTGLNRRFPGQNAALADRIIQAGGALISQFFPPQPPATWTFPMRNVVMSGLSLATVVVEAGETSGARLQARVALQHGRTVFLLQSLVEQHEWAARYATEGAYGTNAIVISSPDEIIERLEGRLEPSPIAAA